MNPKSNHRDSDVLLRPDHANHAVLPLLFSLASPSPPQHFYHLSYLFVFNLQGSAPPLLSLFFLHLCFCLLSCVLRRADSALPVSGASSPPPQPKRAIVCFVFLQANLEAVCVIASSISCPRVLLSHHSQNLFPPDICILSSFR